MGIGIPDNSVLFSCPETYIVGAEYPGYLFDMNDCFILSTIKPAFAMVGFP